MSNNEQHIAPIELLTKVFAGEASPREVQELDTWRDVSAENQKEYDAFAKLWSITGTPAEQSDIDVDAEWKKMERSIAPQGRSINMFVRVLSVAASLVLLVTLSVVGLKQISSTSESTTLAESRVLNLSDGSTVSLNAGSKLIYDKGFGREHRNVTLKGEAFFEVERNEGLPFKIEANNASIEVLGTKFNVKAYKDLEEVKVLVTQGKVQLYETRKPENKKVLEAGQTGVFNKSEKKVEAAPAENQNDIAWKTLVMEFDNTPLSEVVGIIENTYHINIEVEANMADCPITVRFVEQELTDVLKVLKSTLNLKYSKPDDKTLQITGQGCK